MRPEICAAPGTECASCRAKLFRWAIVSASKCSRPLQGFRGTSGRKATSALKTGGRSAGKRGCVAAGPWAAVRAEGGEKTHGEAGAATRLVRRASRPRHKKMTDSSTEAGGVGGGGQSTAASAQVAALHRLVEAEALQWYAVSRAPLYVQQLVSLEAVKTVMCGVGSVLVELGMKPTAAEEIPVFDLAPYWAEMLRQLFAQVTLWSPVDVADCTTELIRRISSGVHSMFWERLRYRHFNLHGAPAGVAELPLYVSRDGQKTFAVNNAWWSAPGKSWAQYTSCTANAPRRRQQLRSSRCSVDDVFDPRAFA